jgi:hypothetical protein
MAPLSDGERRRLRARNGQKKAMEGRRCPLCKRGNALTKDRFTDHNGRVGWMGKHCVGWMGKHCRYCNYARGSWL